MIQKSLIYAVLMLGMVISFNGCKKPPLPIPTETNTGGSGGEGGGTGEPEPSVFVGTWDYTKIDLTNGTMSFNDNEVGTFKGSGTQIKGTVTISENPNVYSTTVEFVADIDATFFGQTQNQQLPVDARSSSGTWTESNGEITMEDDNSNDIMVTSSSAARIVFEGVFEEPVTIAQGFEVEAVSDVEFTIQKK